MRKISILLALVASLFAVPAYADFTGKDASAATITFKNPGTCTSVVCVPVFQIYDGTNVVTLTTAGADAVSNTLTGVPMYGRTLVFNGTTWDRWQGAVTVAGVATAANQATANTSLATIATNSGTQATAANQATANASLATIVTNTGAAIPAGTNVIGHVIADTGSTTAVTALPATPAGTNTIGTVGQLTYPVGAVPLTASATGTTAATTATLAGAAAKTTYICSLSVRANATANTNVTDTVTGVITGTLSRALWVPANTAGLGVDEMIYSPCIPASGTNQAIAVVSGAPGTGGVVTVNATGYQL